jgi:hypothetical protein
MELTARTSNDLESKRLPAGPADDMDGSEDDLVGQGMTLVR